MNNNEQTAQRIAEAMWLCEDDYKVTYQIIKRILDERDEAEIHRITEDIECIKDGRNILMWASTLKTWIPFSYSSISLDQYNLKVEKWCLTHWREMPPGP